jgi:hypothetical protein
MNNRLVAGLTVLLAALGVGIAALAAGPFGNPSFAGGDVSETRSVDDFDKIRLEGALTADVTAGESDTSVVVSGNRDAVDRVTTEVDDGTLVVATRPGFGFFQGSPNIKISVPELHGFSNDGAGSAKITGLTGDVDIDNSGAASIVASGDADTANVSLQGVGKIDTTDLDARDVTVSNDGVGSVHVRASGNLTMNVNGVGDIRYVGEPEHVESQVNGLGRTGRL